MSKLIFIDDADLKNGLDILLKKYPKDPFTKEVQAEWDDYLAYRKKNPKSICIGGSFPKKWHDKFWKKVTSCKEGKRYKEYADRIDGLTLEEML